MPSITGTSTGARTTAVSASLTFSHTTNGDPLYVLVFLQDAGVMTSTVTFNGTDMFRMDSSGDLGQRYFQLWFLPNPGSTTANVVITPNISTEIVAGALNVNNPDLDRPYENLVFQQVTSTTPSLNVTSATGDLVVDFIVTDGNNQVFTEGAGQTALFKQSSIANALEKGAISTEAGGATVAMSWGLTVSDIITQAGFSIPDVGTVADVAARATQSFIEAVIAPDVIPTRVSQSFIEVVIGAITEVEVPDIVGETQEDAEDLITGAGLTVGDVTTACDDEVPAGSVISQDPIAGTELDPGEPVDFVVSTGPCPVAVPDVVGETEGDATTILTGDGFTVTVVYANNAAPVGEVYDQDPDAATMVAPGSDVTIYVSLGIDGPIRVTTTALEVPYYGDSDTTPIRVSGEPVEVVTQDDPPIRVSGEPVEVWTQPDPAIRMSGIPVEVWTKVTPLLELTEMHIDVLTGEDADQEVEDTPEVEDCTGSGLVAEGINPPAGLSPALATEPVLWVEITIDEDVYRFAKAGVNFGMPKTGNVVRFGKLRRSLTDNGGPKGSQITTRFADTDRTLRDLAEANVLKGALVEYYILDYPVMKVTGDANAFRKFRGRIFNHKEINDLDFDITVEDELTSRLTSADAKDLLVPRNTIDTEISTLEAPYEKNKDKPIQSGYGKLSDEVLLAAAEGTVQLKYIGQQNTSELGISLPISVVDVYLAMGHACQLVQNIYGADYQTGGESPTTRARIPESAYGQFIWSPFKPNWPGGTTTPYSVIGTDPQRLTLVLLDPTHIVSKLARENRIPITGNFCATEEKGDGSLFMINNPALAFLHWYNNRIAQEASEDWLPMADFGGYSLFDTDTFYEVAELLEELGWDIEGMLGFDSQISWRDSVFEFIRNYNMDSGPNRHGQTICVKLNRTNPHSDAPVFDETLILEGGVHTNARADAVANKVWYQNTKNYLSALQGVTPNPGERDWREPFDGAYKSGVRSVQNDISIAALSHDGDLETGIRNSDMLEFNLIRNDTTALEVAEEFRDLWSVPEGRLELTFDLWMSDGFALELGTVIKLRHRDTRWALDETRRCQVREIEDDFDSFVITPTVRDVEDLLPAEV